MKLDCYGCDTHYEYSSSDAETPAMFHSKECEQAELLRLREGNDIISKAKEQNPLAFSKTQLQEQTQDQTQAYIKPNEITSLVDDVFEKLGLQKSTDK